MPVGVTAVDPQSGPALSGLRDCRRPARAAKAAAGHCFTLFCLKGRTMTISDNELAALAELDTPTVCNALEIVAPERRASGFNRRPLVCPAAQRGPVIGFARTAMIKCAEPGGKSAAEIRDLRMRYYEYIEQGRRPGLAVIQDVEGPDCGIGAFWGEVQSNIHKALGCAGVITDGSVRDIDQMADGFFVLAGSVMPSHVWPISWPSTRR